MPPFTAKPSFSYAGLSVERLARWRPTLAIWGIGAAGAVSLLMSDVPLYQRDVLKKIPLVASYFEDKTPASDKPF